MPSDRDRIEQLEREVRLLRQLINATLREARPRPTRGGWFLGRLTEDLSYQSSADVEVFFNDGSETFPVPQTLTIEVDDFYLNPGESIASGTKCEIRHYADGHWYGTNFYCSIDETEYE